jgi:hypothetical protein
MRPNLIFARGDDAPAHIDWAARCRSRSWDITLSYFGKGTPPADAYDGVETHLKGVKWGVIFDYFTLRSDLLDAYEYVWFPDDDIVCDPEDIDRLFDAMRSYDLDIAQPALTMESYFSHLITLQQPDYIMRRTNFVEVMMPCIRTSYFKQLLPYLGGAQTGWGLDFGWAADRFTRKAGIIDAIAMTHARPIGGGKIYKDAADQGLGDGEQVHSMERFGIQSKITMPLGGLRKDGRVVTQKWRAALDFYLGLRRIQPVHIDRRHYRHRVNRYLRRIIWFMLAERFGSITGRRTSSPLKAVRAGSGE